MTEFDDSAANGYNLMRQFRTDRRKDTAYNALKNVYGDAAGDPDTAAKLQATQTSKDTADAQQQYGLVTTLQKVRDSGGDVGAAFDQLKPIIASHVDPAHMAGLEQMVKQDPTKLDAIHEGLLQSNPQLAKIGQGQQKIDISLGGLQEKATHNRATEGIGQQNADTRATGVSNSYTLGKERNSIAAQRVAAATRNAAAPLDDDTMEYLRQRDLAGDNSLMGRMSAANKAQYAAYAAQQALAEGDTGKADAYGRQAAKARATAVNDLGKSGLSTSGGIIRANSAALEHMNQFDGLINALGNGDNTTINRLSNDITKWNGGTAPTNVDAVARIAGQEVTKAIIANGGGVAERKQAADDFANARSPEQLRGVLEQYRGLLGGQISSLRQKYVGLGAEKDFDAQLTPTAKANLEQHMQKTQPAPQAAPAAPAVNGPQAAQTAQPSLDDLVSKYRSK